jgi:hypothetical protein
MERVSLASMKPLAKFVTLALEGCALIQLQVKYEKMPHYYTHCDLMGHIHLECWSDKFTDDEL